MRFLLKLLTPLCAAFGSLGALVALLLAVMMVVSVFLRSLWDQPISGDVELTQMGIALAISLCLPYTQLHKANIIVDFFTQKAPPPVLRVLDASGGILLSLMYALLAWRTSAGALSVLEAGETTMIIGLPMWWAYASLAPGLALAMLIALLQALSGFSVAPEDEGQV